MGQDPSFYLLVWFSEPPLITFPHNIKLLIFVMKTVCLVWGGEWILKYNSSELQISRG